MIKFLQLIRFIQRGGKSFSSVKYCSSTWYKKLSVLNIRSQLKLGDAQAVGCPVHQGAVCLVFCKEHASLTALQAATKHPWTFCRKGSALCLCALISSAGSGPALCSWYRVRTDPGVLSACGSVFWRKQAGYFHPPKYSFLKGKHRSIHVGFNVIGASGGRGEHHSQMVASCRKLLGLVWTCCFDLSHNTALRYAGLFVFEST